MLRARLTLAVCSVSSMSCVVPVQTARAVGERRLSGHHARVSSGPGRVTREGAAGAGAGATGVVDGDRSPFTIRTPPGAGPWPPYRTRRVRSSGGPGPHRTHAGERTGALRASATPGAPHRAGPTVRACQAASPRSSSASWPSSSYACSSSISSSAYRNASPPPVDARPGLRLPSASIQTLARDDPRERHRAVHRLLQPLR
jgi:hypothetical protein